MGPATPPRFEVIPGSLKNALPVRVLRIPPKFLFEYWRGIHDPLFFPRFPAKLN
jgi:hypothetical protein